MKKGALELDTIGKIIFYLLLLVVLIGLVYFFKDLLYEKFEVIKNLVKFG